MSDAGREGAAGDGGLGPRPVQRGDGAAGAGLGRSNETGGADKAGRSNEAGRFNEATAREALVRLREEILACDEDLVRVVARRCALVQEVGRLKRGLGLPVTDPSREASVVRRAAEMARALGLDEELVRDLLWKVMASARADQQ